MKKISIIITFLVITMGGGMAQTLRQQLKEAEQNYNTLQTFVKDHPELQTDTSFLVRFARHDFWWQHRAAADGSYATYYGQLHKYMQNQTNTQNATQQWENPGPRYLAQNESNIGRVNSIWINPNNSDHIKIGSASAGLWETTNGGDKWINLTPRMPGGVRDFIVHPTNPNLVYGISEIHNNGMYHHWGGYGIFKSTDGGANPEMKLTHLYLEHKGIKEILFKPGDPQTIYVLTDHRIFISHNAGGSFTDVNINSSDDKILEDLAFSETYPDVGFAYSRGQLYRTTDGGYTWTDVYSSVPVDWGVVWDQTGQNECFNSVSASYRGYGGRNVMGAFDDEIYIFRHSIVIQNNDTTFEKELLVSDVNNLSFQRHNTNIGYDPYNIRKAQNGNIAICTRSYLLYFNPETDSWDSRYSSRHQDVRDVAFHGTDNVDFILATDGGVEYGTDAYYPTYINGDLALNEIHGHTVFQSKRDHYRVGTHDDGGFYQDENGWHEAKDGQNEGAICWQNQSNFKEYAYAYGYSKVGKVMEDDYDILATIPSTSLGAIFFQDPNDQNSFWKQNGSKFYKYTPSVSGASIQDTIGALLNGTSGALLRFSEQNSDIMYASIYHPWAHWFNLSKSTDGGTVWERLDGSSPYLQAIKLTGLRISDIEINPENSNELWITFSRFMENDNIRVLHSIDGGYNWDDITGNLPNIPVTQIEFDPASGRLFVGSDVGLFERETDEWTRHANFPIVPVTRMIINEIYQDLSVSTYGRGIWRTNLTCLTNRERIITQNQVWNQDTSFCDNVRVTNGATLTLNGSVWQPAAADFIVDENSTLVVNEPFNVNKGVTLTFMPGSRLVVNNTEMQIAEYGTLVFEGVVHVDVNNGTLVNNGQFVYSANDTLNVVGAGTVDLYSEGGTVQQLNLVGQGGSLNFIGRNVTVAGGVAFTNVVLKPYGQMTFDNYIISGLQVDCSNGTAVFANMNGKVFENINVHDGEVQVINSTFSVEGQNIFENTMMTLRNMTVSGGYGAFVLRNSDIKSSDDVIFKQGKNRYGTLQVYRTDNGRTHIGNMVFNSNKVALYSYSGSVNVSKCDFLNNALGWKAVNMSSASSINYSEMADNKIAVDYSGYNNATLKLYDSDIMNNEKGINVSGPLSVELLCSNVNSNSVHGVGLSKDASIIAKTSDLSMNKRAIVSLGELDGAKHLFIDGGHNNLKSFSYCVSGIWSHGSPVYARQNQWKAIGSSPVSGVDYLMFSRLCPSPGNYAPITLIDDNPLRKAPECFIFPNRDGSKSKTESTKGSNLEDLVSAADEQYDLENYKHAAELYYEILMDELNLAAENWDNIWYSYLRFQSLSGLVDNYHILFDLNTIQDHLLSIVDENDYQSRLYLHITKAQTMRLQNNFEGAIDYFNYILSFVNDEDFERISRLRCQVLVDKQILEGEILPFELDESLDACIAESMDAKSMFNGSGKGNGSETEHKYMTISPNPASSSVFVVVELPQSYENCVLQIVNQQQRILLSKKLISGHSRIEFNVNQLEGAGLYFVLIKNDGSVIEANELIVE